MKENLTNRMILFLRKLRQVFSRSKWVVRLLSLPPFWDATPQHGVILIQIDALSRPELERTIRAGRMPFLKKLLQENYRLCSHYSGLPSTTPAVQAELLYGVPGVIPAFSFRDHQTGELTSMIDFDDASRIENRLKQIGKGLLQDGGAYCDMYTGGAMHASFCASSPGLDSRLRQSGPVALFISLVLHGFIAVRMLGLFLVEVVLAIIDVFRGVIKGKNLWKELHFIPYRIGVCILLRELTTAGVLIDAALGLPIIHCNFLGYDEHAHRRGPSSTFAHLTLRGIDNCLRRIRDFSTSVASREYDLLIYSDHGQEATLPYEVLTCVSGASSFLRPLDLRQIVLQVLHRGTSQVQVSPHRRERPPQSVRVMTYNVHNCLGMDGRLSLERIARIITRYDPDVVALQEIDVNRARTGNVDQAHQIARMLNMEYHFHPSFMVKEE